MTLTERLLGFFADYLEWVALTVSCSQYLKGALFGTIILSCRFFICDSIDNCLSGRLHPPFHTDRDQYSKSVSIEIFVIARLPKAKGQQSTLVPVLSARTGREPEQEADDE